jgi:hypothetical protein
VDHRPLIGAVAGVAAAEVVGDTPADRVELDPAADRVAVRHGPGLLEGQHLGLQQLELQRHDEAVLRPARPQPHEALASDEHLPRDHGLSLANLRATPPSIRFGLERNRKTTGSQFGSVPFGRRMHRKNRRKTRFGEGFRQFLVTVCLSLTGASLPLLDLGWTLAGPLKPPGNPPRIGIGFPSARHRGYRLDNFSLANRLAFLCRAGKCLPNAPVLDNANRSTSAGRQARVLMAIDGPHDKICRRAPLIASSVFVLSSTFS